VFEIKMRSKKSDSGVAHAIVVFSILGIVVTLFFIDIILKSMAFRDRMGSF
jgi:hypothetical protein